MILGALGLASCGVKGPEVSVLSFNIRYATPADREDYWENRKDQVVDVINTYACDFVGIQEALPEQIKFLTDELISYSFIWRTREADPQQGEAVPLLYQFEKWELIDSETFWLSDTPEIPGSNSWNGACNRIATWGKFSSLQNGFELVVCNTHFDHISQEARQNGARLLVEKLKIAAPGMPVIFMGDLNGKPDNPAIRILTDYFYDPYPDFYPSDTVKGTFHGFTGNPEGQRIDYILCKKFKQVAGIEIVRDHLNERYPSDHFPVYATINY